MSEPKTTEAEAREYAEAAIADQADLRIFDIKERP